MRYIIAAGLIALSLPASAALVVSNGLVSITLLDSACSSEVAAAVLKANDAKDDPKRADVMISGVFVPACWATDADGDILLADRKGSMRAIYRDSFKDDPGT